MLKKTLIDSYSKKDNALHDMRNQKTIGVQLGRFAPFHNGHNMITKAMLDDMQKGKLDEAIIMIGSANILNKDVPFTAMERLQIMRQSLPESTWKALQVCLLDDTRVNFDDSAEETSAWAAMIEMQQTAFKGKFIFYTGAEEDSTYLQQSGLQTYVAVDRYHHPIVKGINATNIRNILKQLSEGNITEEKAIEKLSIWMSVNAIEYTIECLNNE